MLKLRHFSPVEFRASWLVMDRDFLYTLDEYRERLGRKVMISPAPGSLYRAFDNGDHGHLPLAVADVMLPEGPDLETAFNVALEVGFTAVGVYPFWEPYPGLHLAKRPNRTPADPATWADIGRGSDHNYVGVAQGFIA